MLVRHGTDGASSFREVNNQHGPAAHHTVCTQEKGVCIHRDPILHVHCSCLQGLEHEMPKRMSQLKRDRWADGRTDRQTDGRGGDTACLFKWNATKGHLDFGDSRSVIARVDSWESSGAGGTRRLRIPTGTTPHTSWVAFRVSYILDEVITDKKSQGILLQTSTSSHFTCHLASPHAHRKAHFPAQR